MIEVQLYEENKKLEFRPSTFELFCEEMQKMFEIDNPDKFTYEYLTNDEKFYPLNVYNYSDFYNNNNIKKICCYAEPEEAFTYNPEEKGNINNIIIKKDEKEEENGNPNFYEDNIDNNENININQEIINADLVKQKIVNEYKEKMKKMKMLNKEKEEKEKIEKKEENIISNNNEEINKIIISNEKEVNENMNIDNQLNDIINKNFEKLKND